MGIRDSPLPVALSLLLTLASCRWGGTWLPFPIEGARISSTDYHNDTIELRRQRLTVRIHGRYSDWAYFYITVHNGREQSPRVDLPNIELSCWFVREGELQPVRRDLDQLHLKGTGSHSMVRA